MSARDIDLVVIGAGPVGENVADRAVQGGLSVVIVEHELVGGECSYWACMPSKALLRSGEALDAARAVPGAAEAIAGDLDVQAVLDRRDAFTSGWSDAGQVSWLESAGISLVRGHAAITGEREVTVTDGSGDVTVLHAMHAVAVATGTDARIPDTEGLADAKPWTSREATSVEQVPGSLAIIGGGVVASEMATAYASLGATVTVLARTGLLGGMEPFAGELVAEALRSKGVDVRLDTEVTKVTRDDDGVHLETSAGVVTADEVLVATGRAPRTTGIGLESIGLVSGDWLHVEDTLLVDDADLVGGPGWLYAVGDVNHRALLTHQGKYQARAAGDVIVARAHGSAVDDEAWGAHVATADAAGVPQVAFTDPEAASVGLTLAAAEDAGMHVRAVDVEIGGVAGASLRRDGYAGTARMVVDEDRGVVVGMTFVGPEVSELLHAATIAVVGEVPIARLWHAVPSYPTVSEVWLRLLESYGRESATSA